MLFLRTYVVLLNYPFKFAILITIIKYLPFNSSSILWVADFSLLPKPRLWITCFGNQLYIDAPNFFSRLSKNSLILSKLLQMDQPNPQIFGSHWNSPYNKYICFHMFDSSLKYTSSDIAAGFCDTKSLGYFTDNPFDTNS